MNDLRDTHALLDEVHFVFDLVPSDRLIAQTAREPAPGPPQVRLGFARGIAPLWMP